MQLPSLSQLNAFCNISLLRLPQPLRCHSFQSSSGGTCTLWLTECLALLEVWQSLAGVVLFTLFFQGWGMCLWYSCAVSWFPSLGVSNLPNQCGVWKMPLLCVMLLGQVKKCYRAGVNISRAPSTPETPYFFTWKMHNSTEERGMDSSWLGNPCLALLLVLRKLFSWCHTHGTCVYEATVTAQWLLLHTLCLGTPAFALSYPHRSELGGRCPGT